MILNVFLPAVIWMTAVANGLAFAWTHSGLAFCVAMAVVVAFAAGSAAYAPAFVEALRKETGPGARIVVYGMAIIGMSAMASQLFVPGWLLDKEKTFVMDPEKPQAPFVDSLRPLLPPGPARLATVPANVLDLIPAAQEMLRGQTLDIDMCGGSGEGQMRCLCDYKLAVSDTDGNITIVDAYEERPSTPAGYRVIARSYEKKFLRACGTNPIIDVSHPPGQTVLAIRTVVKTTGTDTLPAVFTPFTDELNIPELRQRGLDHWWKAVLDGRDQLAANKVPSLQRKGELLTDVIPPMTVFMLGLVENLGSDYAFGSKGSEIERLRELNAVLVMFGANGSESFASRVSGAKAAGVLQIVDTTGREQNADVFTRLRTWYPGAAIPSYRETVRDHRASVRFAFVHLDEELRALTKTERRNVTKQPVAFGLFSAAGYNGTALRAARVMRGCTPEEWAIGSCGGLHDEAASYVRRFLGVYPLITSEATIRRLQEEIDGVVRTDETKTE